MGLMDWLKVAGGATAIGLTGGAATPFVTPLIASGISGALNNRSKTSKNAYDNTSTTNLSPQGSALNDQLLQMIKSRLSAPSALPGGFQESGIRDINKTFALTDQGRNANLTARGLSDSPIAAMDSSSARAGAISQFNTSLPLVERDLRNQDMDFASRLFAMQPRTTTSSGTGSQTTPGNMAGGAMSELASMLGFMIGQGQFGGGGGSAGRGGPFDARR